MRTAKSPANLASAMDELLRRAARACRGLPAGGGNRPPGGVAARAAKRSKKCSPAKARPKSRGRVATKAIRPAARRSATLTRVKQ